jgi:hypothetical protein
MNFVLQKVNIYTAWCVLELRIGLDAKKWIMSIMVTSAYFTWPHLFSLYILSNYIETEVVFELSIWKPHLVHTDVAPFIFLFVMTTSKISLQMWCIFVSLSVADCCENRFTIFMVIMFSLCRRHVTSLCDILRIRILLVRRSVIEYANWKLSDHELWRN